MNTFWLPSRSALLPAESSESTFHRAADSVRDLYGVLSVLLGTGSGAADAFARLPGQYRKERDAVLSMEAGFSVRHDHFDCAGV